MTFRTLNAACNLFRRFSFLHFKGTAASFVPTTISVVPPTTWHHSIAVFLMTEDMIRSLE